MPKRFTSYRASLLKRLQDPDEAVGYLEAAAEEDSIKVLLQALRNVAEARKMSKVAEDAGLDRATLHRMLSPKGNPTLVKLMAILRSLNLRISVVEHQPTEMGSVYTSDPSPGHIVYAGIASFANGVFSIPAQKMTNDWPSIYNKMPPNPALTRREQRIA